jgi:hypothetical protein
MEKVIAQTSFFGQRPGEERFEITVEIGAPYQCGEDPEEWACPVAVSPLYKRLHDAHGGDSFQSWPFLWHKNYCRISEKKEAYSLSRLAKHFLLSPIRLE